MECKDCGEQIEEGATECPKCGTPVSNKILPIIFSVILSVIIFIGVALYFDMSESTTSSADHGPIIISTSDISPISTDSSADESKTEKVKKPLPPAEWTVSTSRSGRANDISNFATSPTIKPMEEISYQYRNIKAWMSIGCKKDVEWAFVGFNMSPILGNTITEDGYDVITTIVEWGDSQKKTILTQEWSSNYLHFSNRADAILRLSTSDSVFIKLNWLEGQTVKFKFSLKGSTSALRSIRKSCATLD